MSERSINLRLAGGLGNQLFELAFAIHVAKINSINKIYIDDRFLGLYHAQHKNYLQELICNNQGDVEILTGNSLVNRIRLARVPINSKLLPFISDSTKSNFWTKKNHKIYMDGYFVWKIISGELRRSVDLIKKNILLPRCEISHSECLMHIRGGDFNSLGWNSPNIHNFYNKSIDYFRSVGVEVFRIITDDISYAKSICGKFEIENYIIEKNDMKIDFLKILSANNKIISGSSFAMWATMLGENNSDVRIAISSDNSNQLKSVMDKCVLVGIKN